MESKMKELYETLRIANEKARDLGRSGESRAMWKKIAKLLRAELKEVCLMNEGPFADKAIRDQWQKGPFADKAIRDQWQIGGESRGAKRHPDAVKALKKKAAKRDKPPFKKPSPGR